MTCIQDKVILKTPGDASMKFEETSCVTHLYLPPSGPDMRNELCDCTWQESGTRIPYHYHDRGIETCFVLKGKVEVTLYGRRCICEEGDFINILPWCPCGMVILAENTVLRKMYTGRNQYANLQDRYLLSCNAPDYTLDAAFMETVYGPEHYHLSLTEPVDTEAAEKGSFSLITSAGKSVYTYAGYEGIRCHLKITRTNLNNVKEIWEFELDRGYTMTYARPVADERLYIVQSGQLMVNVGGNEWVAEKDHIVHIPAYTPFALTALSENVAFHDYNVTTRLFRMLEMLQLAQRDEPEKVSDPEWMKWLLTMNQSTLTGFGKSDERA